MITTDTLSDKYVCDNCHESTGEKTSRKCSPFTSGAISHLRLWIDKSGVYDISIFPSPSPPPGFEKPSAKAAVARKPRVSVSLSAALIRRRIRFKGHLLAPPLPGHHRRTIRLRKSTMIQRDLILQQRRSLIASGKPSEQGFRQRLLASTRPRRRGSQPFARSRPPAALQPCLRLESTFCRG